MSKFSQLSALAAELHDDLQKRSLSTEINFDLCHFSLAEINYRDQRDLHHQWRIAHIAHLIRTISWPGDRIPTLTQLARILNSHGIPPMVARLWTKVNVRNFLQQHGGWTVATLCAQVNPRLQIPSGHSGTGSYGQRCHQLYPDLNPTDHADKLPNDPALLSTLLRCRTDERLHAAATAETIRVFFRDDPSLSVDPNPETSRFVYKGSQFPWLEVCERLNHLGSATPTGLPWRRATLAQFMQRWRLPYAAWAIGTLSPLPDILHTDEEELEWMSTDDDDASHTDTDDLVSNLYAESDEDDF